MKLTDDFHEQKSVNMTLINMTLLMSIIVIAILGLVFWVNMPAKAARKIGSEDSKANTPSSKMEREAEEMKASVEELISGSTLTSNDLDIWNMQDYEEGLSKDTDTANSAASGDGIVSSKSDYQSGTVDLNQDASDGQMTTASNTVIASENVPTQATPQNNNIQEITVGGEPQQTTEPETDVDPSTDGNHIKVRYANGENEWIEINPKLTKNDYDFTKLMYEKPIMNYYVDGKRASYFGMDISKDQGVVDFIKFKKAGGEFVMLKLGGRGYSSGQIVLDEKFAEYAKNALDADLHVGVYFFSQAASKEEAEEEAKLVIDNLKGYKIKYPVVFRMETIGGDMTRVDDLTVDERTEIASTFLNKIKAAGYIPMLYGDKEWLLTKYNLEKLQDYEIWYVEAEDIPDYPYKMGMWQYTTQGAIDGVAGNIKLDISFKDYSNM